MNIFMWLGIGVLVFLLSPIILTVFIYIIAFVCSIPMVILTKLAERFEIIAKLVAKLKIGDRSKKGFFGYQKFMFYVSQAGGEIGKPLRFVTELGVFLLLMSDSGFSTSWQTKIIAYIVIMFLAALIGFILSKTGVIHYNASLGNKHNPELIEILERMKRIEERSAK